jgi:aminopeptidase N
MFNFLTVTDICNIDNYEYSLKNDQIMDDVFFPIMHQDSVASSHPISVNVNNPDEINEIFDDITYSKVKIIIFFN